MLNCAIAPCFFTLPTTLPNQEPARTSELSFYQTARGQPISLGLDLPSGEAYAKLLPSTGLPWPHPWLAFSFATELSCQFRPLRPRLNSTPNFWPLVLPDCLPRTGGFSLYVTLLGPSPAQGATASQSSHKKDSRLCLFPVRVQRSQPP